ncbi:putative T7SS-secreted protein [Nocardia sp. IFM 10818]
MGLFDEIDNLVDIIDRSWEKGVEKAGELADDALDAAGSAAQKLGMDSLAEGLDDLGDQIVSAAGGELEERQLGETKDPKELIRGEPTAITEAATTLRDMATQISSTGDALRTIDAAGWEGDGADGFNAVYDQQPKLWWDSAESFTAAAGVLDAWSNAVKTAQARAADAITEWERALTEERGKKDWWNNLTGDQQKAHGPLADTWTSLRDNARAILRQARVDRDNAAADAAAKIAEATAKAPTEPPFTTKLSADFSDLLAIGEHAKLSFESGLLTGLSGMVQFIRSVNPSDTYNMTHPAEYLGAMSDLGTGLVVAASDPGAAVDAIISEARTNPFEFAGALTGEALVTVATGGAGAAKPVMSVVDKLGDIGRRTNRVTDGLPDSGSPNLGAGSPDGANTHGTNRNDAPSSDAPSDAPSNDVPADNQPREPLAGAPREATPDSQSGVDAGSSPDGAAPESPATRPDTGDQPPARDTTDDTAALDTSPAHQGSPHNPTPDTNQNPQTTPDSPARNDTQPTRPDTDAPSNDPATRPDDDIPPRSETPERDTTLDENAGPREPDTNLGTRDPEPDTSIDRPETDPVDTRNPDPEATSPGAPKDSDTPPARTTPDTTPDAPAPARDPDSPQGQPNPDNSAPVHSTNADSPNATETDPRRAPDHTDTTSTRTDTDHQNSVPPAVTHPGSSVSPNPSGRGPDTPAPARQPDTNPGPRSTDPANTRNDGRDPSTTHRDQDSDRSDQDTDREQDPTHRDEDTEHRDEGTHDADSADGRGPRNDEDSEPGRAGPAPNPESPDSPIDSRSTVDQDSADGNRDTVDDERRETTEQDTDRTEDDTSAGEDKSSEEDATDDARDGETDDAASTSEEPDTDDVTPENDQPAKDVTEGGDPVDVATGEFLLPETDLDLPGILDLVLKRRHRSNYRFGRWFGPSWSATLDMRIVVGEKGVTVVAEDGVLLAYPHAEPDTPVTPLSSALRWTLTRAESGAYRLWDPDRELIWHFAPEPVLSGLDVQRGNYAISAITDRHANRIRFHYDADGNPTEITHTGGYRVRITTAHGRVTALDVVDGETLVRVREFGYRAGDLIAVTNGDGGTTHYAYDTDHRMLSWTDSNGNHMRNTYDERGRVIRQRGPAGVLDCEWDYLSLGDGTGTITTHTNSLGATTTHGFDHDLRLRDILNPVGARTHYDYNTDRHPLRVIAPDGATTHYTYTDFGDVASITRPDGASITLDYLFRHRPTRITDVDGTVRHREYDERGNLTALTDPTGNRTEYTHHPSGATASITAPNGAITRIETDAAGLPTRVIDPLGAETTIKRDGLGRPIRVTDPLGAVTRYHWSPSGKLLHRTAADDSRESWTYDGEGNLLTHTNPAGGITRYTYGAFDLLSSRTDPAGATTIFTWDTERRLTAVHNPNGQTWLYHYDPAGRLTSQTDYTGATTHYTHDKAGRTATITPATGITRHHTHDLLGRLTSITTDSGDWIHYTHDIAGRLLKATNGNAESTIHTLRFGYSPTGLLESQQLDAQSPMLFTHDQYGRRTRRTTPTGAETRWHYDYLGRPSTLTADGHDIDFTYDPTGRLTRWRLGELAVESTHDPVGRLLRQEVTAHPVRLLNLGLGSSDSPGPKGMRTDEYTWRADGYITSHTSQLAEAAPLHRDYDLDPLGRVTCLAHNGAVAERYTYDLLSNITTSHISGVGAVEAVAPAMALAESFEAKADPHRFSYREYRNNLLVRDGRTRYRYDESGRLIRKTTARLFRKPDVWHYRYNSFDQLTDVWTPDHQWWHYTYDGLGRRTTKQRLSRDRSVLERVDFAWDASKITEQVTHDSVTRWIFRPHSHRPIAQTTDRATLDREFYAVLTDLVGTPVELVDPSNGESIASATADLWGRTIWRGEASTPLRFPGQTYDSETGLHYSLHRIYDPATARFLTGDPLGLRPAPNPGIYPHNPTRWADPLGLAPEECVNGGSWDANEEPYLYRGVPHATSSAPFPEWYRNYQNALEGVAEPNGLYSDTPNFDPQAHVGTNETQDSMFTSWTTDYEDVALPASQEGNGPGVVLRIPNSEGPGYSRVPGISYPYTESEVTIAGTVRGAEVSIGGGPWMRVN